MKCFYSAYTNINNVGDLLITKYQIEEFAKYGEIYVDCNGMPVEFKKVIFETASSNVRDFVKTYGVSYRSKKILRAISIINKNGFTHFSGSPGPREPLRLPIQKLIKKAIGALLPSVFLRKEVRVISLGVDINCDFNGFWGFLNKWYFKRYDLIGIRSHANLKRLESYLDNVVYIPDMAFLYPGFEACSYVHERKRIGISFRKVNDCCKLIDIVRIIDRIAKKYHMGIDILYQVDEDRPFCQMIKSELESDVNFIDEPIDFYSLDLYQKYDMVISNRLHVLLMASMNGALPYGIISESSNELKIRDIFDGVFGDKLVSTIKEFSEITFLSLFDASSVLRNNVKCEVEKQRAICLEAFSIALSSKGIEN